MNLVAYNLGQGGARNPVLLTRKLAELEPDVLFVQETRDPAQSWLAARLVPWRAVRTAFGLWFRAVDGAPGCGRVTLTLRLCLCLRSTRAGWLRR